MAKVAYEILENGDEKRVFAEDEMTGLEIKYSKLTMVPDSTLMIGDIIASGETLIHCLRYVTDFYRKNGARLRNIIVFTIGGTKGIDILEELTKDITKGLNEIGESLNEHKKGDK